VPYPIHTILTDNGIRFAKQPRNRNTAWSRQMRFDMICEAHDIEHRLTKPNHPWTNGQVERMNRTIKEATVKRFHYESHDQLRMHLADFMAAYNFACRLKTLSGLTLRIHRQNLDVRARPVHRPSDPPDAGTKHLDTSLREILGPAQDPRLGACCA
jgi:transposase InsO family protein